MTREELKTAVVKAANDSRGYLADGKHQPLVCILCGCEHFKATMVGMDNTDTAMSICLMCPICGRGYVIAPVCEGRVGAAFGCLAGDFNDEQMAAMEQTETFAVIHGSGSLTGYQPIGWAMASNAVTVAGTLRKSFDITAHGVYHST